MTLTIHPDATREGRKSVEWYEDRQSDLGRDFDAEIQQVYDRIEESPECGSRLETFPDDPTV